MKKVLKRIFIVILIILIAVLAWRLSLLIRAIILENKIADTLQREYYRKQSYASPINEECYYITEEWYGEQYSKITYTYVEKDVKSSSDCWYDNVNRIYITDQGYNHQMVVHYLRAGEKDNIANNYLNSDINVLTHWDFETIKYYFEEGDILGVLKQIFVVPLTVVDSITTETIDGKEYYVIKEGLLEYAYYVEKDTYLITKTVSSMGDGAQVINYEYSFEPITKESIDFPNLDEYYVLAN